jgi:hypothetical protein
LVAGHFLDLCRKGDEEGEGCMQIHDYSERL